MQVRFGSVCAGIEAASVAFEPLGWAASWFSEIDPFASAVLAHHYPEVPNVGDMMELNPADCSDIDLMIGGTPCQSFSVAGYRKGLEDERGNLALSFVRIADSIDDIRQGQGLPPLVVVWENVSGVFSTGGNPFGCFLGALCGEDVELVPTGETWTNAGCVLGPRRSITWRTLDAQYFGLAQRRQRVFVVGSARQDIDPGQILFEFHGVRRDIAPSQKKRPDVAQGPQGGFGSSRQLGIEIGTTGTIMPRVRLDDHEVSCLIPFDPTQLTHPENRARCDPGAPSPALKATARPMSIAWSQEVAETISVSEQRSWTLEGNMFRTRNVTSMGAGVRRLTPGECEILMGFPRGYTAIPYPKKALAKDAPRYRALGNSMAVPVVRWIGERIDKALEAIR